MKRQRSPLYQALRKHKEALASIEVHKRWITKLEARAHDLEREIDALGGRPEPKRSIIPFAVRGEMQKTLYDLLRERGEVTAADLAAVMLERYVPTASPEAVKAMRQRAFQCIRRNEVRGTVRHVGGSGKRGQFKRWALAILKK